jgi:hypothetical protein
LENSKSINYKDVEVFIDMLHKALRPLYELIQYLPRHGTGFHLFMAVTRLFLAAKFSE